MQLIILFDVNFFLHKYFDGGICVVMNFLKILIDLFNWMLFYLFLILK